jgi:competence protein ComFC
MEKTQVWAALKNLLFPALCLHCKEESAHTLCSSCLFQLTLLEPEERCPHCFSALDEGHRVCLRCLEQRHFFKKAASAFEQMGPAASLLREFKYGDRPHLAQSLAALMILQFFRLDWPLPDLITSVPQSALRRFRRGYNQSALLAKEIAYTLERPALSLLRRCSGDIPQTSKNKEDRSALSPHTFSWKKSFNISGKIILLIDDSMASGTTLNHCIHLLEEGCPAHIFCLTFSIE